MNEAIATTIRLINSGEIEAEYILDQIIPELDEADFHRLFSRYKDEISDRAQVRFISSIIDHLEKDHGLIHIKEGDIGALKRGLQKEHPENRRYRIYSGDYYNNKVIFNKNMIGVDRIRHGKVKFKYFYFETSLDYRGCAVVKLFNLIPETDKQRNAYKKKLDNKERAARRAKKDEEDRERKLLEKLKKKYES